MSTALVIASLLRIARTDLDDARQLAQLGSRNAAYLCEQAAEKIIKALLTAEGIHAERAIAHRLDLLIDRLPDENPFRDRSRPLERLTAYATAFRYPTAGGRVPRAPDQAELALHIALTRELIQAAAEAFQVNLDDEAKPAGRTAPPRRT